MRIHTWVRRHPLLAYIALISVISWGGLLVLAAPYGMPARQNTFATAWPIVFLPYLMGPAHLRSYTHRLDSRTCGLPASRRSIEPLESLPALLCNRAPHGSCAHPRDTPSAFDAVRFVRPSADHQ